MENKNSNRNPNASTKQKRLLLEFMKKHPNLVSGKFSDNFSMKDAQKLWCEITDILNSCGGGANKDWKCWRKTWQDIRCRTKQKYSKAMAHQSGTAGGPYQEYQIGAFEKDVLETMNLISIKGHTDIKESYSTFILEEDTSTSTDMVEIKLDETSMMPDEISIVQDENNYGTPRMDTSISSSKSLRTLQLKNQFKAEYYQKKIEMLERTIAAKERMAAAMERSAAAKERSADAKERAASALELMAKNKTMFHSGY